MALADTYEKAEQYISEMPRFTKKNSLDDTKLFLEILGSPEKGRKIIHVAGTNGKGSVCAYLCSILTKAGYCTGMFTSPHLVEMRERFRIGQTLITKERFLQGFLTVTERLEEMRKASGKQEYHPSFFELLFLMGMVIFREEGAEYIVLEAGLGGRLDATNAVQTPVVTVITSIGFDHMKYLGNTIEEIAGEKAGILKPGIPVIFCDKIKEASDVIQKNAAILGNKAVGVKPDEYFYNKLTNKSIDFLMHSLYYGYIRLKLATAAIYQAENAAIAIRCIEQLPDGRCIGRGQIEEALEETFWEGRMEEVLPGVYADGAHNADGIRAFIRSVEADGCKGSRYLLFSAVGDKDYEGMIDMLKGSRLFMEAVAVGIHDIRGIEPERLAGHFEGMNCSFAADVIEALYDLLSRKREEDFIYIAGSLYLVGEVKAWLRRKSDD